jgi:hypothetical protein
MTLQATADSIREREHFLVLQHASLAPLILRNSPLAACRFSPHWQPSFPFGSMQISPHWQPSFPFGSMQSSPHWQPSFTFGSMQTSPPLAAIFPIWQHANFLPLAACKLLTTSVSKYLALQSSFKLGSETAKNWYFCQYFNRHLYRS